MTYTNEQRWIILEIAAEKFAEGLMGSAQYFVDQFRRELVGVEDPIQRAGEDRFSHACLMHCVKEADRIGQASINFQ